MRALLHQLNADPAVSGILLQLPTPPHIDGPRLTEEIAPGKDVDGLTPISTGLLAKNLPGPAPVHAARLHGAAQAPRRHLDGAEAVVVGRSDLVGKPISALLLQANATVTTAPLAHAGPRGGLPPRRRAGRRRRRRRT